MRRRSLPRLVIAVPCPADWRSMEPIAGDSRARLCRRCDKPVYDSKSMTHDQLHALIMKTEGSLPCLQLHQRPDGTIVTKGCLSALRRTGRLLWLQAAALAVAFWAGVIGLRRVGDTMTAPRPRRPERGFDQEQRMMGMVAIVRRPHPALTLSPPREPNVDRPPLRHLLADEELLPRGWRD